MADNHDVKIDLEGTEDVSAILGELAQFASDPWTRRYIEDEFTSNHEPLFEIVETGVLSLRVQPSERFSRLLAELRARRNQG
jgi:hypothetical protein